MLHLTLPQRRAAVIAAGGSRITAWRAAKQGWWCPSYRTRHILISTRPIRPSDLTYPARIGAAMALRTLEMPAEDLQPWEFADLEAAAIERLLELTGDDRFRFTNWKIVVARNAALRWIRSTILIPRKFAPAGGMNRRPLRREEPAGTLPDFDGALLLRQVRQAVEALFGPTAWSQVQEWLDSEDNNPPPAVAELLSQIK